MTVEVQVPYLTLVYTGTGDYSFNFDIASADELQVIHEETDGVETTLILDTDYTVAILETGGTVTSAYSASSTGLLKLTRLTPIDQQVDFVNNEPLNMEILEVAFDKLTRIAQDINDAVSYIQTSLLYRGSWTTGLNYYPNQLVSYPDAAGDWYVAKTRHLAGTLAPPDDSTKWELVLQVSTVYQNVLAAAISAANALDSENAALASELKAEQWADEDSGIEVEVGKYSAKHWAVIAQLAAGTASGVTWFGAWVAGTYPAYTLVTNGGEALVSNKETSAIAASSHADWDLVATWASSPDVLEAPTTGSYYARKDGGWADVETLLQTIVNRFSIISKTADFTIANSDADYNPLYECDSTSAAIEITIPTATAGGYAAGDVITFEDVSDGSFAVTFVGAVGVTIKKPDNKLAEIRSKNGVCAIRYKSDTVVTLYGDLENA